MVSTADFGEFLRIQGKAWNNDDTVGSSLVFTDAMVEIWKSLLGSGELSQFFWTAGE